MTQVSIGFNGGLPGVLNIPGELIGWSGYIIPCSVEDKPAFLLQSGAGPDAWWALFVYQEGSYTSIAKYSYSAEDYSLEDKQFDELSHFDKIKFLLNKALVSQASL